MFDIIPKFVWILLLAFSLNGITVLFILIFKNKIFRTTNILLLINLFAYTLASIIVCLIESRWIIKIPHLYRLPSPIFYLTFPVAYLYLKLILEDRNHLYKKEYLHFLPAALHLIEMLPFYLKSSSEKIASIKELFHHDILVFSHSEGWFPPYVHNIIRGFQGIIYAIVMWQLLRKYIVLKGLENKNFSKTIIRWLKFFTIVNGSFGVIIILTLTLLFITPEIRSLTLNISFLLILWISDYYLLFHPEILYGIPQPIKMNLSPNGEAKKEQTIITDFIQLETINTNNDNKINVLLPIIKEYKIPLNNHILPGQTH